ncbi:DNA-binding transcriptional regulator, GntR family [Sinosporangium album]|uniref:DNA-binding transcriptional regulator, GntR family n=1 Tax=Sinosporangium album TaxID=504805 RepID=A0A1G8LAG6_9ACTN|nr:GntR family transcriptional regulator [Sinosporangium album]SDI52487.1 DNA-binding transcriptional regulator, GntR family [Sinosporangium album]
MATRTSARSLTERVYVCLRGDILAGRIAPGQKLKPSELSAAHGVSLNVVREALSRLAGERLVRALPQQGFAVIGISVDDLADLTDVRATIETAALRRSVDGGDLVWEAELVAAHHRLAGTPMSDPESPGEISDEWMRAHNAFHQATMAGCNSPRMLEIVAGLGESASIYRYWSQRYGDGHRDIAGEHRGIFEAALARDADLACRLHREHIQRTAEIVINGVSGTERTTPEEN